MIMRPRSLAIVLIALPLALPLALSRPAAAFEVICRDGWGARAARGSYIKHVIKRLTVHHSGRALKNNRRAPGRIAGAQRYHQAPKKGWPDIAYHYLIDLRGNIYEGRPTWARGDTGTRYDTTGHFLVCVVGNYEVQPVNERQVNALVELLAWAAKRFKVSPETIRGHRQLARTSCPGKHLQALVEDGTLRRRVEKLLAAGGVKMTLVCGEAAKARVKAIRRGRSGGGARYPTAKPAKP